MLFLNKLRKYWYYIVLIVLILVVIGLIIWRSQKKTEGFAIAMSLDPRYPNFFCGILTLQDTSTSAIQDSYIGTLDTNL